MDNGWISIYRKFTSWKWYRDTNTKVVFLHLLLNANYADKNWLGIKIKRGELITSRENLAKELNLTVQNIRTSLTKLKSTGEITIKTTNRFTHISIDRYDFYQNLDKKITGEITSKLTNNQPATNQQLTTNNKEINNIDSMLVTTEKEFNVDNAILKAQNLCAKLKNKI